MIRWCTTFVHDHTDKKSAKHKEKRYDKKKKKSLVDRTSQTQVEHESKKLLNGKENKESVDMDQSNNKKGTF